MIGALLTYAALGTFFALLMFFAAGAIPGGAPHGSGFIILGVASLLAALTTIGVYL